jgi:uncharacterized membrane protein YdjX (TVP38/TMEM64 family)
MQHDRHRHLMLRGLAKILFFALLGLGLYHLQRGYRTLTPAQIGRWIDSLGYYAPLFFIVIGLVRPFVFFPITFYYIGAGLAFGVIGGLLYGIYGVLSGALVLYLALRLTGTRYLPKRLVPRVEKAQKRLERNPFRSTLIIRLVPGVSFDIVSLASGVAKIPLLPYVGTLISTAPRIAAYTFLGSELFFADETAFWAAIGIVACLILLPIVIIGSLQSGEKGENRT